MQLHFFSGKGFIVGTNPNKIYLYRNTGKIHIYGELCKLLDDYQEPFIHIFNEVSEPVLIYFTPVLIEDNINTKARAKEAIKLTYDDNHYSGSCIKLFKDMNILAGPPKQKGSKSSGHYLEYYMLKFLDRDCAVINLQHIDGWSLK